MMVGSQPRAPLAMLCPASRAWLSLPPARAAAQNRIPRCGWQCQLRIASHVHGPKRPRRWHGSHGERLRRSEAEQLGRPDPCLHGLEDLADLSLRPRQLQRVQCLPVRRRPDDRLPGRHVQLGHFLHLLQRAAAGTHRPLANHQTADSQRCFTVRAGSCGRG